MVALVNKQNLFDFIRSKLREKVVSIFLNNIYLCIQAAQEENNVHIFPSVKHNVISTVL